MGLLLRYLPIAPINGIVYTYVLHAHSHVMFLGWVFNVLIIAFSTELAEVKGFKPIFWFLQCCVLGMLVTFPFQGYAFASIAFSTLHTIAAFVFIVKFFRTTKQQHSLALLLAKAGLLYFALASIGPFFLGYLKAQGLDHSNWYRYSIYFYLHFQYNGFFLLGVLSLFIKLIENVLSDTDLRRAGRGGYILIISCLPAYFLSVLWSDPSGIFYVIGFLAAFAQLVGLWFFARPLSVLFKSIKLSRSSRLLFSLAFAALMLKSVLQILSAVSWAATFADQYRSVLIAYLHLVLLGFISFFLLGWLIEKKILHPRQWAVRLLVSGFIVSEVLLVIFPWNDQYIGIPVMSQLVMLFVLSFIMVVGLALLILPSHRLEIQSD